MTKFCHWVFIFTDRFQGLGAMHGKSLVMSVANVKSFSVAKLNNGFSSNCHGIRLVEWSEAERSKTYSVVFSEVLGFQNVSLTNHAAGLAKPLGFGCPAVFASNPKQILGSI